jgi:glutamyl-Q tRNA(Asp) synthetase
VKSSTATATTATAEAISTGRFAPSPTGPLHLGSLVAAVGSYLDARSAGGHWLLRLEDLDTARNVDGADTAIVDTLCAFGFRIDGEVVRQSLRLPRYEAAIAALQRRGLLFHCRCSRRDIAAAGLGDEPRCVGGCRSRSGDPAHCAIRVALDRLAECRLRDRSGRDIHFDPLVHTDVVIRRRDGVVAYHLAVVVDDAEQGVTDVVRGGDLLASTPWQIGLQQALSLPQPRYLHLPVVVEPGGAKLAKSRRALPLDAASAPALLHRALALLGQRIPDADPAGDVESLWRTAIARWDPVAASRVAEVTA